MSDTTTTTDAVSRVYAEALYEMARDAGVIDEVAENVAQLGKLINENDDLQRLLGSPVITQVERKGMIERLFAGRVHDLVYRFLQVVNQKDRLAAVPGIVRAFNQHLDEQRGVVEVEAHVAERLDDRAADSVAASIGESLGKQVQLRQSVDPDLIGGIRLRIGDRLIDGSVASRLQGMRRRMMEAGAENAKQASS